MRIFTLLLSLTILLAGCGSGHSGSDKGDTAGMTIYTSIYPLQYFAERIGGDEVEVHSIVPPGSDGHTFEPTTKELIDIAEADLLVYNGAGFESFIDKAKDSLENQDVLFVNASAGIERENEQADDHSATDGDPHSENPHVWLDPILAVELSETIKDAMVEKQPELKSKFEENFKALKKDLEALNRTFEEMVARAEGDTFIVAHSAYGHWEERYGLNQVAVTGISPSHEPSQKDVQGLIDFAKSHHISYILLERNISSNIAEMIGEQIDAEVLYLSNLESLTPAQAEQGEDYISIMKQNIETLEIALNGEK